MQMTKASRPEGRSALMAKKSMARVALQPAPTAIPSAGSVSTSFPMSVATAAVTAAVVEEPMSCASSSHERVQFASHAAHGFMGFAHVILGIVAVWDRWCHEGAAGGEVVGVHFTRNCVLNEKPIRPGRSRQSQPQPKCCRQCQREWHPSPFSEKHGLSLISLP
jgi:hypothetical protein